MHQVILLHTRVTEVERPWHAALLARLPYAKRLDLERRAPLARHASLAGIALALQGAGRLAAGLVEVRGLEFPDGGKPQLRDGPEFSVSHSGAFAACAVATTAIGLDVECVDPHLEGARVARLARWTATEAVLKAHGLGIRRAAEVALDARLGWGEVAGVRYVVQPVDLGPGCTAHVATAGAASCVIEACDPEGPGLSAVLQRGLGLGA